MPEEVNERTLNLCIHKHIHSRPMEEVVGFAVLHFETLTKQDSELREFILKTYESKLEGYNVRKETPEPE